MKLFNLLTIALATIVAGLATVIAQVSTYGCIFIVVEEPKMPKALIK